MRNMVPDEVILGLLEVHPTHGYVLLDRFRSKAQLGRIWTMSTSQLYAVLKRLDDNGAIKGHEVESQEAPPRIEYSVTEKGSRQLKGWLFEENPSTSIHRIRVMFLSRLYIASELGLPVQVIIENQIRSCKTQYQRLKSAYVEAGPTMERLTLEFVLGQLGAALKWLEQYQNQTVSTLEI